MSVVVEIPTPEGSFICEPFNEERSLYRDIGLEFLGTFVFVYISLAGVHQAVLTESASTQLQVAICFMIGLASGIIVAGRSGGHLNPAVTLTTYMTGSGFGLSRLIGYMLAQLAGGFIAGMLVLAVYYSWIKDYPESNAQIGAFGTLRDPHNSLFQSILDQFIGSALLMFGIVFTPASWSKPITIGAVLGGLGLFQGTNGFAFNPARDLGPRLASSIIFSTKPFTVESHWFWVPLVIPFFGVAFGWKAAQLLKQL